MEDSPIRGVALCERDEDALSSAFSSRARRNAASCEQGGDGEITALRNVR